MGNLFTPFSNPTSGQRWFANLFWITAGMLAWQFWPGALIPRPLGTWNWLVRLYEQGLVVELWVSAWTIFRAGFLIAFPLGCVLSYLYTVPFFKPPVVLFATIRNMSMTAIVAALVIMHFGGDSLKVTTMTIVICVYFVSSVTQHFDEVLKEEVNHGITMRMSRWQILWHRVVRQRFHVVCYDFVPCIAMGWSMLSFVEGLSRSEGGLGDLMLQVDKINSLEGILALAIVSTLFGFGMWWGLRALLRVWFRQVTAVSV